MLSLASAPANNLTSLAYSSKVQTFHLRSSRRSDFGFFRYFGYLRASLWPLASTSLLNLAGIVSGSTPPMNEATHLPKPWSESFTGSYALRLVVQNIS